MYGIFFMYFVDRYLLFKKTFVWELFSAFFIKRTPVAVLAFIFYWGDKFLLRGVEGVIVNLRKGILYIDYIIYYYVRYYIKLFTVE